MQLERTGIENKWFALSGHVVAVKAEADGDLHITLADATVDKPGIVVCEVPAKPQWCEIRTTVQLDANTFLSAHTVDDFDGDRQGILGHRSRAQRSIKPQKEAAPVCCLGDSSGDDAAD